MPAPGSEAAASRTLSVALWASAATALAFALGGIRLRLAAGADLSAMPHADAALYVKDLITSGRLIQVAIGTLTSLTGVLVLAIERRLATPRGVLRATGVAAVLVSGMLALAVTEPLGAELAAAAGTGATLDALLARWQFWLSIHTALAVATFAAFAVAPRLERLPAPAATLTVEQRRLLVLLGSATYFEGYDRFIVLLALPYIGRDIGAGESTLGWALFWIRMGALLSLVLAAHADRHGRRRVLLLTVVGYTLATFLTAFTRDTATFVLCQFVAMIFLMAELSLAHVVIAEEFPAHLRGLGLGVIGGFGTLGAGAAAMLFPILQATSLGWRGLYLIGVAPLVLITYLRRALPETRRWESARARGVTHPGWGVLARPPHLGPIAALVLIAIAATAAIAPAFSFFSFTATTRHGWDPAQVSMTILVGGSIGVLGWPVGGRLADVLGRRFAGTIGLVLASAAIVLLYDGAALWIAPAFSLLVFAEACVTTVVAALATECVPTAIRSSAKAVVTHATIVGAVLGLGAVGAFSGTLGGAPQVIVVLAASSLVSLLLLWTLPETAGADLDRLET